MTDIYSLQLAEGSSYLSSTADPDWEMIRSNGSKAYLFWVNVADNSGAAFQYYYSTGSVSSSGALNFYISESTNTITLRPQATAMGVISGALSFPTGWILVSHQYNRDTFMWELAITPEGGSTTRVSSSSTLTNNQTLNAPDIGRRKDGDVDRYYGGKIGSIAVTPYNTLLSDVQLESLAASFIDYDPTTEFTPVLHFPFNEGSGSTVTDTVKGLVLNGTSVSAGWVLEGSTGVSLDVTPSVINSASSSNNPSIEFNSVVEVSPLSVGSSSAALNPVVSFESVLNISPDEIGSSSTANEPSISFSSVLNIAPFNVDSQSEAKSPVVDFTSALSVSPQLIDSYSLSLNPSVQFKSVINISPKSTGSSSIPLNPVISTGEIQEIGVVTASFKESGISVKYKLNQITVNFK